MAPGRLFLVPNLLGAVAPESVLPTRTLEIARGLRHVVAENAKVARAFLKSVGTTVAIRDIALEELNEHTPASKVATLLAPAIAGEDLGLMSDAGCPGVADPGARLVAAAHAADVQVIPLVGPSAILLALMASGLNGQAFTFHGYLPAKAAPRTAALLHIEQLVQRTGATQLFIEAPYRNAALLHSLIAACAPDTLLAVAADLTLPTEEIALLPVAQWRRRTFDHYQNRPSLFLLGKPGST